MAKKRRTAAQKQRTHARQQHQLRVSTDGSHASTSLPPPPTPKRSPATRPPRKRPAARSRRSSPGRSSWAAIGGVVVVIALMIVLFVARKGPSQKQSDASAAAIAKVTSVPASTLDAIGVPTDLSAPPHLPSGTAPVESDGKPMVLYIGAEYCPFCAAERWPVVVALSRFGKFTDLGTTTSAANDTFPNTPTLSFYGSSYTSDYIALSSAETQTNEPAPGGGYTRLQDLTSQQQQLADTYNTGGGIPFVMIGNLYAWSGSGFDPGILEGKSFDQIANALADPNSEIAKAIDGVANQITAEICKLTGNQPADVCSAPWVTQAQAAL